MAVRVSAPGSALPLPKELCPASSGAAGCPANANRGPSPHNKQGIVSRIEIQELRGVKLVQMYVSHSHSTHSFIQYSVNNNVLSIYHVPGTVLDAGGGVAGKTLMVLALIEVALWWRMEVSNYQLRENEKC